jgi:hypothetical protein
MNVHYKDYLRQWRLWLSFLRKITYGKIVCDYKPHKKEKERVRLTLGGLWTSTADITTFKILINSTLSKEDAAMMMMDIKTTDWVLLCHALST